jgi:K+-sensing histidine kinase KdpD
MFHQRNRNVSRRRSKKTARGEPVRYQVDMVGKNDEVKTIDFSLKPVLNEEGETVLVIPEGRGIADLKRAGKALQRHQRVAAHVMRLTTMGEMASGMGMGLSISRSIIETHGGRMGGSNSPQGGAAFGFSLPIIVD